MATQTETTPGVSRPLVTITELDHIVLRVSDVEDSLRFYSEILGLQVERVEQWRAGEEPIGKDGAKNQDHYCMVIEPTDMEALKAEFEALGIEIQAGPGKRWGSHGDGISLYIYDPDDNVVELRHY
ncbi:Glyoxalase domain-containing protein 5 [Geodia barretti]|uniref:Glyoxalase domain-containing protein 5 n=1 Tax=Geodia barretti TaxID=519541 RepID=A0AA35U377_GEOBA|nr:Glyoxalase domain-containing protein 5 [Geodia barretti]